MKPSTLQNGLAMALKMKRWLKTSGLGALALAATVSMTFSITACGNSGGGNRVVTPVGAPVQPGFAATNCVGCAGGMNLIGSGLGRAYSYTLGQMYFELGLDFYSAQTSTLNVGSYMVDSTYSGGVAAQGRLVVNVPQTTCALPVGSYTVRTLGVGAWGGGGQSFGGLTLEAIGPTTLRLYIPSAFVSAALPAVTSQADGRQYPYRIEGRIQIMGTMGAYTYCDFTMAE